jgi:putative ABC transport system permease protein
MHNTSTTSFWALAWRSLWRDWRAGELRLLVLAIALAVAALTAVGFFADRIQNGLQRDARQLLGGDAVVRADQPLPTSFVAQAENLGLELTAHVGFPTMALADEAQGGNARLVALKAVAPGYPLRGTLRTAAHESAPDEPAQGIPAAGTVWVDSALLVALEVGIGDTISLGDKTFRIDRLIVVEPDRGAGFMSFAPRVMLPLSDLAATGLVQPASRVNYRLVVAGPDTAVKQFEQWAQTTIDANMLRGVNLESFENGRPEMQQTLGRAEKFLNLVALLAALLSAVAVAIAARAYAARHVDDCAMLRVLGLSQATMARAYTLQFVVVGVAAGLLGVLAGYAVHHGFVWLLAELVKTALPAASLWPAVFGLGVGLILMLGFGLPPILQLAKVPAMRVIRRDVGHIKAATLVAWLMGVLAFAVLLLLASRDWLMGGIAVGGFAAALLLFAGSAFVAVKLLRMVVARMQVPSWLQLATRQLTARPAYAVVQVSALSVGLLALVLLVLLRTDLITSWQQATPPDAPNRFVINIQPEQAMAFEAHLQQAGVESYDWYPMIRGRLVEINGKRVDPDQFEGDRAKRLVDREFNLSHGADAPPHNRVVAGRWTPNEPDAISVEDGLAETLGLKLGDVLTFDMAGIRHETRITSLRKVDWGSMRVNFFAMYPVSQMKDVPISYISAFKAPDNRQFDNQLLRAFPNVTNVDTTATVAQVQRVLGQVIRAVEFLFAFTLAAGLVVLFAAISATRAEREREYAILRAVGASSQMLRHMQRAELLGVGFLAGLQAALVAVFVGWALAHYVFEFTWTASAWVPLVGAVAGALLALMAGWWSLRGILRTPVVHTLRRAATS